MTQKEKAIEIPFGAKDSELIKWEYTIPEGMEAEIKDGKVIIKKAESENERIRKAIVHYILYETKATISEATKHTWVKWLEKQKEKPKSADSIPSDCMSDAKCEDRWHKVGDSLPDNGREVLAKDKLGNTLLARYDGEGWDVSVYDDEDYRCHNGISQWCEIPFEEQKPVEWSEEDENGMFSDIIMAIRAYYKCEREDLVDYVKSLRPSWKPSEEQMKALEDAYELYWKPRNGLCTLCYEKSFKAKE